MQVSIIEPKGVIWEGSAKKVVLPAEDGEICVLDFHQPFLMRLRKGQIRMPDARTAIQHGIAFMKSNSLKIFVET